MYVCVCIAGGGHFRRGRDGARAADEARTPLGPGKHLYMLTNIFIYLCIVCIHTYIYVCIYVCNWPRPSPTRKRQRKS